VSAKFHHFGAVWSVFITTKTVTVNIENGAGARVVPGKRSDLPENISESDGRTIDYSLFSAI